MKKLDWALNTEQYNSATSKRRNRQEDKDVLSNVLQ